MCKSSWNGSAAVPRLGLPSVIVTAASGIVLRPALRTVIVSCVCCESVWLVVQTASTETGNLPVGSWASWRGCEPHAPSAITATRPAAIEQLLGLHPLKTRPT